jgi:hypothetical protein
MTTNRQGRHTRRHSENLLDGTVPVTEPLSQVLDDARRAPSGAVDGEQDIVAAYRWAQQSTGAVQTTLVLDRGPRGRTVAVRRIMAAKVLAAAAVTVTLGGVALAATMGGDPVPVAATTSARTSSGPAVAGAGAVDPATPSAPTARVAHTPGTPDHSPAAAEDTHGAADKNQAAAGSAVDRLTRGERVRMARICRAWVADGTRPATARDKVVPGRDKATGRDKVAEELYRTAGGSEKAFGFCIEVVRDLCRPWSETNRPTWQCPYALDQKKGAPVVPPIRPTVDDGTGNGHPGKPTQPMPQPVITGGPVVNRVLR